MSELTQHKKMANTNLHSVERYYAGNPDGSLSGIKGQYCKDTLTGYRYVNTDGTVTVPTTNWEQIFDPDVKDYIIEGDGNSGRVFRFANLVIQDGLVIPSIKCTFSSKWNGDTIATTDNITKGATVGDFSLNPGGDMLTIENSGLSGDVKMAFGTICRNYSLASILVIAGAMSNDIVMMFTNINTGALVDITTLVNAGDIQVDVIYFTDA